MHASIMYSVAWLQENLFNNNVLMGDKIIRMDSPKSLVDIQNIKNSVLNAGSY